MTTSSAIAFLESQGYDLSSVKAELQQRQRAAECCFPTEIELTRARLKTPAVPDCNQQKPVAVNGQGPVEVYRVLGCDTLHEGCQVRLTSGQRTVIRNRYGMTPTELVKVAGYETYPSRPDVVSAVTIESGVPSDNRTRVLRSLRIDRFGLFLELAAQLTQETTASTSARAASPKTNKAAEIAAEY